MSPTAVWERDYRSVVYKNLIRRVPHADNPLSFRPTSMR